MLTIWCSMLFDDVMVSGILDDAVMCALTCILSANDRNRFSSSFFFSHPFWLIITEKCLSNSILNFIMTEWWVQRNNGDYFIWSIFSFVCPISIPFGSIRMNLFLSSIMFFFSVVKQLNSMMHCCCWHAFVCDNVLFELFSITSASTHSMFFDCSSSLSAICISSFFPPFFVYFFFPISVCCFLFFFFINFVFGFVAHLCSENTLK